MSPELETLDQLLGGDMSLTIVRELFENQERFARAIAAMLDAGEVRLVDSDGTELPRWRWREVIAGDTEGADLRLSITDAGERRVG
jgi:hypothetical protein